LICDISENADNRRVIGSISTVLARQQALLKPYGFEDVRHVQTSYQLVNSLAGIYEAVGNLP